MDSVRRVLFSYALPGCGPACCSRVASNGGNRRTPWKHVAGNQPRTIDYSGRNSACLVGGAVRCFPAHLSMEVVSALICYYGRASQLQSTLRHTEVGSILKPNRFVLLLESDLLWHLCFAPNCLCKLFSSPRISKRSSIVHNDVTSSRHIIRNDHNNVSRVDDGSISHRNKRHKFS